MTYGDNTTKGNGNTESVRLLTKEARTLIEYADKIQFSAERIMLSCSIPGTNGEAYRDLLLAETNNLKKLADLHRLASQHLLGAAGKLINGSCEEEVLSDVRIYNIFFADQLKCAENEVQHILGMLLKYASV